MRRSAPTVSEPRRLWADVVLPPATLHELKRLAAAVRKSTSGTSAPLVALFRGDDRVEMRNAARALATSLDAPLYRIDLSSVISKYIGETEKNLSRVFDAAEDAGALLFFDEADALFGGRSEVEDSHDRYASQETACLLRRLEKHRGLVILATRSHAPVDRRWTSRRAAVVEFPTGRRRLPRPRAGRPAKN